MKSLSQRMRIGMVGVAVASLGAAMVTTLAAQPALAAGPTVDLAMSPTAPSASAGTCVVFTITPLGSDRLQASDTNSVTIRLSENPNTTTQDVDFCSVAGVTDAPSTRPFYKNGQTGTPDPRTRETNSYTPGASITPDVNNKTASGASLSDTDNPDSESSENMTDPVLGADNTNPTGVDTAVFSYSSGRPINFGVVGQESPGAAAIQAFIDKDADATYDAGEIFVNNSLTFTPGGKLASASAGNAVTTLDAEPETAEAPRGQLQLFSAVVRNTNGHTVAGVRPVISVTSGPNASSTKQVRADCGLSDNNGVSNCAWQGTDAGVDTLNVYVNKSTGTGAAEANEAQDSVTRITSGTTNTDPSAARYINLTPDSATSTAGIARDFTAIVTDVNGNPVQGAVVTFTESGPGSLTSTSSATNSSGRAVVTATSTATESGTQTISATLASGSQCSQPAGSPAGSTAGRCTDSSTNVIGGSGGSPSPTPSGSRSPSPTASGSPPPGGCQTTTVRVNTRTINATGLANVTVTGARPNSNVQLQGYSQNHFGTATFDNDPTPVDRSGNADANGTITFSDLRPASNTRLRARMTGCMYSGQTDVIEVRAQETLEVRRVGTRSYTFSGRSIPAREGGLIVSLYRIVGSSCAAGVEPRNCPGEVFIGQSRAVSLGSPGEGLYSTRITFPARDQNVRDEFVVKTGRDAQNAPGRSNVRSLLIF